MMGTIPPENEEKPYKNRHFDARSILKVANPQNQKNISSI
jgi:hypothetical protein